MNIQEQTTLNAYLCPISVLNGVYKMKNDNLNIMFTIGNYQINILKFTFECQTWNTPCLLYTSRCV